MNELIVRGIDLHFDIDGSGPTEIWGHGLTSSRAHEDKLGMFDWKRLRENARVLRYDARGHGQSGSTAEPIDYHWRELAHDQLALADALGIDTYIAGGASMGCATALHAATIAPDRIGALILVIPPTAWATRAAQQQGYELGAQLIEAGQHDAFIAGAAATPPPDPLVGHATWQQSFDDMVRTTDPVRLARIFRGAATADLPSPDAIAALKQPTLILAWTGDPGHPMATAEQLLELMPHAQLHAASTFEQLQSWTDTKIDFISSL